MKSKLFLLIYLISMTISLFGQNNIVNQFDSNGKKHGTWIEYLNAKWKVMKDSSRAVYCAYNYYDHGENTYRISFDDVSRIHYMHYKLEHTDNKQEDNKIKILDGEYKWLDKKGRTVSIDSFKNGEHVWSKYFAWPTVANQGICKLLGYRKKLTGKLHVYHDFTKKYNKQPHTYYIEIYDKKGNVKHYTYMRKDRYGWCAYEEL